jgi:predicted metallo-beta-lactamase superfamily hydrolase
MHIEIIGTESLGVRGLSCKIQTKNRKILIDPGIALGYNRSGLLPHPFQVAVGRVIRKRIVSALRDATDVVISHYHGDHIPLVDANPYQLKAEKIANLHQNIRFWAKGLAGLSQNMKARAHSLSAVLNKDLPNAEGSSDGPMVFSGAVPHGEANNRFGQVMMTKIKDKGQVFVHASDIQLLDRKAILRILQWHPDIVLASGPPLYLPRLSNKRREIAWQNAVFLSQGVNTLILDHHMMRCEEGVAWLKRLSYKTGKEVVCAADFMKRPRLLLEARRRQLYKDMPVPKNWHRDYTRGKVDVGSYQKWRDYNVKNI